MRATGQPCMLRARVAELRGALKQARVTAGRTDGYSARVSGSPAHAAAASCCVTEHAEHPFVAALHAWNCAAHERGPCVHAKVHRCYVRGAAFTARASTKHANGRAFNLWHSALHAGVAMQGLCGTTVRLRGSVVHLWKTVPLLRDSFPLRRGPNRPLRSARQRIRELATRLREWCGVGAATNERG